MPQVGWCAMLPLLLLSAACAAELKPKNIEISLSARWAATPLELEAAEFMADEGLFWRFAEAYRALPAGATDQHTLRAIEHAGESLLSPLRLRLLRVLLSAHVFSPRVEMWRQIGVTEAAQFAVPHDTATWLHACGRAHVLPADGSAADVAPLVNVALADARTRVGACAAVPEIHAERVLSLADPLSVDQLYGPASRGSGNAPLVVLYAPLGSEQYRVAHAALSSAAAAGQIRYVLRPLIASTASHSVGDVAEGDEPRQTLQGYGVLLAIKNMEYKAMDDQEIANLGLSLIHI